MSTADPLKALLTTWRESIPKHRAEASRLEDEGLSIYSMGESALATGKEKCADELEAALLALGERQETAEPRQVLDTDCEEDGYCHVRWPEHIDSWCEGCRNRAVLALREQLRLAAHREGPATAEPLVKLLETAPRCPIGIWTKANKDQWFSDYAEWRMEAHFAATAHREWRPPAAEKLETTE